MGEWQLGMHDMPKNNPLIRKLCISVKFNLGVKFWHKIDHCVCENWEALDTTR
jgi:hypothetical protein